MKNLLLMTILLGTIACNGSGGGGPKVEVGPKFTTVTYSIYDDVVDTDFNPCGNGNLTETVGNTVKVCKLKGEDRPYEYTEKYWPSVGCTEINTATELKECGSERVTSHDVSHLEGLDNLYITNNSNIAVFSDMVDRDGFRGKVTSTTTSLTIKPSYIDGNGDWIITLYNDGTFYADYLESDNILSSNIVSWWIEDELLVIETPSGLTKLRGSRE